MTQAPKRKGARRISEVPSKVLGILNAGETETVNLVEWLAVDQRLLVQNVLPKIGLRDVVKPILEEIEKIKRPTQNKIIPVVSAALLGRLREKSNRDQLFERLCVHQSDMVRSWAAFVIGLDEELKFEGKLAEVRRFAVDSHFGVREIAWFALRPDIEGELTKAIRLLSRWSKEDDENIRRFASESTRPRGVWCKHIEALKQDPELGLPIIEPLSSDPSKYVRDSVANWLNDAGKSQPQWVSKLCHRWLKASKTEETAYIVKRALRTIEKNRQ